MSYIPPPNALPLSVFEARIKAGAKTMKEIDPELYAWARRNDRLSAATCILWGVGLITSGVLMAVILLSK